MLTCHAQAPSRARGSATVAALGGTAKGVLCYVCARRPAWRPARRSRQPRDARGRAASQSDIADAPSSTVARAVGLDWRALKPRRATGGFEVGGLVSTPRLGLAPVSRALGALKCDIWHLGRLQSPPVRHQDPATFARLLWFGVSGAASWKEPPSPPPLLRVRLCRSGART